MTVAIPRRELDSGGLRREEAPRVLALAPVPQGRARGRGARAAGMGRQASRD